VNLSAGDWNRAFLSERTASDLFEYRTFTEEDNRFSEELAPYLLYEIMIY